MKLTQQELLALGPEARAQIARQMGRNGKGEAKYHNVAAVRVLPNGRRFRFASMAEARRYDLLALELRAGQIRDLRLQPQFTLVDGFVTAQGETVRPEKYVADFAYKRRKPYWQGREELCPPDGWYEVVEDVKGKRTRDYVNKRKQVMDRYGIIIQEVKA